MWKNYLKTAFRNLEKKKNYALINIMGLATGIAACLLLFITTQFETSFDNFHKKRASIYRVGTEFHNQDGVSFSGGIAFPVAAQLKIDFPQLEDVASIYKQGEGQIIIEDKKNGQQKKLQENNVYYAQPDFFKMFDFEFVNGSPDFSLKEPGNVVLTQKTAEKYFGDWRYAPGKTIKLDNKYTYKVSGILKDIPANSDFPLSVVVSFSSLENTNLKRNLDDWVSTFSGVYTFVLAPADFSVSKFNSELRDFAKRHKPVDYSKDAYITQPLTEMHYDSRFGNFNDHTFSHGIIKALALIGIFLIIIACVNFINLATAQAVNRSKEVGVRKALGSNKSQLTIQFLSETALLTVVAVLIATALAEATLPLLNRLLEAKMTIDFVKNSALTFFIIGVAVVVTLLSGIYPAIIMSGFNPVTALKSKITSKMVGGISLRRVLVVLQFVIAQALVIGMLIVVSQLNLFENTSLGFDRNAIINVGIPEDSVSRTKIDYLRNRLLINPDIKNISFSYTSPLADGNWQSDFNFNHAAKSTDFNANLKWADADYFKTYNISFVAGRPYYPSDTVKELVVNETLLKKLGINNPQDAIGKEISFWDGVIKAPIVGVVRDFNSLSLKKPMSPVILGTWKSVYQTVNIKIKPRAEKRILDYVQTEWNKVYPDYVYEYKFLDNTITNFYKQENQLALLYKIFAVIAIFISCLGLYGLVSFMATQRTKEVGIRKVLGASIGNIVYLFSREFALLIFLAFLIAAPISYYIMNKWQQDYAYKAEITVWIFLFAIIGSLIVAFITVGHRAVKAALANPVKSLRTE